MARRHTIRDHPDRAEIDAALARREPIRAVAARFGVSKDALHRYQQSRSRPVAEHHLDGSAAGPIRPVAESPPSPVRDTQDDLFDVVSRSFPWSPGEVRTTDPLAEHLRMTQRQFGTAAVRSIVLDFVNKLTLAGMPDVAIARKLDVPPELVRRWRAEQVLDQRAKLVFDPQDHLARELSQLDQMERPCWARVLDASKGSKAWTSAMTALLRIKRQRQILLAQAGLSDHLRLPPPPEPQDDARGLGKIGALRRFLNQVVVAYADVVGLPDDTPVDRAWEKLHKDFGGARPAPGCTIEAGDAEEPEVSPS